MSPRATVLAAMALIGGLVGLLLALRGDDPAPAAHRAAPAAAAAAAHARVVPAAAEPAPAAVEAPATPPPAPARAVPPLPLRPHPAGAVDKPAPLEMPAAGQPPLWSAFDGESRDEAWASEHEEEIERRLEVLLVAANHQRAGAVEVARVECRSADCRLLVVGRDQAAFEGFVESLQDERGFYGYADQLALDGYSAPADKLTGSEVYQVRVHLHFTR